MTTQKTHTTTAQQISALLHDDGQVWTSDDGRDFAALIEEHHGISEWRDGYRTGDVVRHSFPDDSVLLETGGGWDFGYVDCYCWQGEGHTDECHATRETIRLTAEEMLSLGAYSHLDEAGKRMYLADETERKALLIGLIRLDGPSIHDGTGLPYASEDPVYGERLRLHPEIADWFDSYGDLREDLQDADGAYFIAGEFNPAECE